MVVVVVAFPVVKAPSNAGSTLTSLFANALSVTAASAPSIASAMTSAFVCSSLVI